MKSEYIDPGMFEHLMYALTPTNRLVCQVCLHTGLRVGDVLQLRSDALKKQFTITEQKTGKKRKVVLTNALYSELMKQAGEHFVFEHRTDKNKHRTRQTVYADIKRAAKAFRLKENLTPHSLRKIYAVKMYNKYGSVEKVRQALNHDSEVVTLIYAWADMITKKTHS